MNSGLDWMWVEMLTVMVDWIGLDWISNLVDWVGLDFEKWTHGHLWYGPSIAYSALSICYMLLRAKNCSRTFLSTVSLNQKKIFFCLMMQY